MEENSVDKLVPAISQQSSCEARINNYDRPQLCSSNLLSTIHHFLRTIHSNLLNFHQQPYYIVVLCTETILSVHTVPYCIATHLLATLPLLEFHQIVPVII